MILNNKEIGKRIREIRKKKGYTLEEFGQLMGGITKASVCGWEHGVNLTNEKRLKMIADFGGISIHELLYGRPEVVSVSDDQSSLIERYGTILDQYEVVCDGQCIRQQIYNFEGKKYLETWHNGKRIISLELCH